MKIVKKANGNIVILNTDGTVKQVIQQTGIQMLNEGNQIKLLQVEYPIAYIDASEVTHTQIEPAAQVAFSGDNSALMTLLAEDFFVLASAVDDGGYLYAEISITSAQILAMGTTPIQILPSAGAGKYYEYFGKLEYNFGTTAISLGAGDIIGITDMLSNDYTGTYFNFDWSADAAFSFGQFPYQNGSIATPANLLYIGRNGINEGVYMTTWSTNDPTLGDGTMKVKIKYKVVTFG